MYQTVSRVRARRSNLRARTYLFLRLRDRPHLRQIFSSQELRSSESFQKLDTDSFDIPGAVFGILEGLVAVITRLPTLALRGFFGTDEIPITCVATGTTHAFARFRDVMTEVAASRVKG